MLDAGDAKQQSYNYIFDLSDITYDILDLKFSLKQPSQYFKTSRKDSEFN